MFYLTIKVKNVNKLYLDVRYEDKNLAKQLGARWDPSVKRWYCAKGSPLAKIFSWRKAPIAHTPTPPVKNGSSQLSMFA